MFLRLGSSNVVLPLLAVPVEARSHGDTPSAFRGENQSIITDTSDSTATSTLIIIKSDPHL